MVQEEDPNLVTLGEQRKHDKCWWCGQPASQQRTFTAHLTPLSRTDDGRRHTRDTLKAELEDDVEAWKKAKLVHPKCTAPAVEALLAIIDQVDQDNADAQRLHELEYALIEDQADPAIAAWMQRHGFKIGDRTPA